MISYFQVETRDIQYVTCVFKIERITRNNNLSVNAITCNKEISSKNMTGINKKTPNHLIDLLLVRNQSIGRSSQPGWTTSWTWRIQILEKLCCNSHISIMREVPQQTQRHQILRDGQQLEVSCTSSACVSAASTGR